MSLMLVGFTPGEVRWILDNIDNPKVADILAEIVKIGISAIPYLRLVGVQQFNETDSEKFRQYVRYYTISNNNRTLMLFRSSVSSSPKKVINWLKQKTRYAKENPVEMSAMVAKELLRQGRLDEPEYTIEFLKLYSETFAVEKLSEVDKKMIILMDSTLPLRLSSIIAGLFALSLYAQHFEPEEPEIKDKNPAPLMPEVTLEYTDRSIDKYDKVRETLYKKIPDPRGIGLAEAWAIGMKYKIFFDPFMPKPWKEVLIEGLVSKEINLFATLQNGADLTLEEWYDALVARPGDQVTYKLPRYTDYAPSFHAALMWFHNITPYTLGKYLGLNKPYYEPFKVTVYEGLFGTFGRGTRLFSREEDTNTMDLLRFGNSPEIIAHKTNESMACHL